MASTIASLCQQLKQNPTQFKLLTQILQELLTSTASVSTKLASASPLNAMLSGYLTKLCARNQATTYNHIVASCQKYAVILLTLSTEEPELAFASLSQFVGSVAPKQKIVEAVASEIISGRTFSIDWSALKDCAVLRVIFDSLLARLGEAKEQECEHIIQFLLQIQHMNELQAQTISTNPTDDANKEFKASFQKVMVECLSKMQANEELDIKIYHRLGDKVFSKLASPLVLAQFLIGKYNSDGNPAVQIEVLSSLFILVGKYGLEMDQFYDSLERMIARKGPQSIFKLKNSKRFLKLVESAMRSSRVPFKNILTLTTLVLRQIFKEESEFTFWALSFFVNLVKKHRQLQAHLSQLPQVELLKSHYSARVRSLVAELSKNLNKSQYLDIEQFGRVNCAKVCQQKLEQIEEKMEANDEQIEFKVPTKFSFL